MPLPFLALDAMLSKAVKDHLSNVFFRFNGKEIAGIFRQTTQEGISGFVSGNLLSISCASIDVAGVICGDKVEIDAQDYEVTTIEPKGSWVMLRLIRARG